MPLEWALFRFCDSYTGQRLQSRLGDCWIGVAKYIVELFCSMFYLLNNTLGEVAITVRFVLEVQSYLEHSCFEPRRAIDE